MNSKGLLVKSEFDCLRCKRIIDLAVTFLLSPIIFVLVLVICFLHKVLGGDESIFFKHRRVGKSGKEIVIWKFRTMYSDSDRIFEQEVSNDPKLVSEWNASQKLCNDPRVTPFGAFLRKTSLDELPQFLNVIRGDISLIGPRPITYEEISKYGDVYGLYKSYYPGLTGLWQVSGRNNLSYCQRVELDKFYMENWSIWLDLKILVQTPFVILTQKGAH